MSARGNFISTIPPEWIATRGAGANIGIVESGCDVNHPDLKGAIKDHRSFGDVTTRHGNHVIATICGATRRPWAFNGLCPMASVYVAMSSLDRYRVLEQLRDALRWLLSFELDVVNLSLAYPHDDNGIKKLLQELSEQAIVICAYSPQSAFPHSYNFVLSIGNEPHHDCDLLGPKKLVSLLHGNRYGLMAGTSMSAAFASSVAGLARAYDKKITRDQFASSVRGAILYQFEQEGSSFAADNSQIIFGKNEVPL